MRYVKSELTQPSTGITRNGTGEIFVYASKIFQHTHSDKQGKRNKTYASEPKL